MHAYLLRKVPVVHKVGVKLRHLVPDSRSSPPHPSRSRGAVLSLRPTLTTNADAIHGGAVWSRSPRRHVHVGRLAAEEEVKVQHVRHLFGIDDAVRLLLVVFSSCKL